MNHDEPVCEIERDENGDVFVLVDGMKIAKRGRTTLRKPIGGLCLNLVG
jgi:hypothetical protein